jgi:precorrin-8X/cobalt-precorrin-8 methylmutase
MVRAGFLSSHRPLRNPVICCIGDENVREFAARQKTTRSAAAVEFWKPILRGAVVVIGNAPTALFALLEALDGGAPRPAAIIAMPVGFVGAAESKDELIRDPRGTEYFTLRGRRGGSAMAAAALNALIENHRA